MSIAALLIGMYVGIGIGEGHPILTTEELLPSDYSIQVNGKQIDTVLIYYRPSALSPAVANSQSGNVD